MQSLHQFSSSQLSSVCHPLLYILYVTLYFLSLSSASASPVERCDFLNLAFLCLVLPKRSIVMRWSIETSNRLMVHLAELINSYVEVEKASGGMKKVVSPSPGPQITFEGEIVLQRGLHHRSQGLTPLWTPQLYHRESRDIYFVQ